MTEDAWVVAARSVEKMRTEIVELQAENEQLKGAWTRMSQTIEELLAQLAELQAKNEALHAQLEGSQFSRAVIANLRAALSRIVAAIPGRGPIPDVIDGPWTDSIVASVLSVEVRLHDKIARLHDKIAELRKECGQHAMIGMETREKLCVAEAECQKLRKLLVDPATEGLMRDRATMAAVDDIKSLRNQVAFLSEDQLRLIKERDNTKANYDSVARNLVAVTEQKDAAQTERDALRAQLVDRPARSVQDMVAEAGVLRDQYASELDSLYAYARDRLDPDRDREPVACACSPKYREIAPGVHAAYCPLAGEPT